MAGDMFLMLDGIKGESQDAKHKDEIDVLSFSWGASNPAQVSTGTGLGAGKVSLQDINVMAATSVASPNLFKLCCTGKPIKKAKLTVRKQGDHGQEFYFLEFENLIVTSYASGGQEGSGIQPDSFSLAFISVKMSYAPQKEDGSLGAVIPVSYNIQKQIAT